MRRRWETADTVVAISAALLVAVFAIFGFLVWQGYSRTLDNARRNVGDAADIVATESKWFLATVLSRLDAAAAGLPAADSDPADAMLADNAPIAIYGADGRRISGDPSLPADISSDAAFAALSGGRSVAMAPPADVRIAILRRIDRGDAFGGAALMTVPESLVRSLVLPPATVPGATGILAFDDGTALAAWSSQAPQSPAAMTRVELPTEESGAVDMPGPGAGEAIITGFRRIPELGLVAAVTVSRATVLAPLWEATRIVTWLMAPFAIGMFAASLVVARLLRRSERTRRDLAAALEQNQLLFREIHHRVKNNLQSIASLLQLQPIPAEVKAEMGQRIAAMSTVHEQIYRSDDFRRLRVSDYVSTLLSGIRAGHNPAIDLRHEVADVYVDRDAATPLGLIINEVVANAYKHAFPAGRGTITVSVRREGDDRALLTIEDDGVGYDPAQPSRGIGRRLVDALAGQIGGRAGYDSGAGSRFTLSFPLAA